MSYNGYKDRDSWNMALHINNDEQLYYLADKAMKVCDYKLSDSVYEFVSLCYKADRFATSDHTAINYENCKEYFELTIAEIKNV